MGGTSPFERIVGGTPAEKDDAAVVLQDLYERRLGKLAVHEVEKSPEELVCIETAERVVNTLVEHYGGIAREVPLDHLYVLSPGSLHSITEGRIAGGIHYTMGSKIGVERDPSKLAFTCAVAHEVLHLQSPKAARVNSTNDDVTLYRSGLTLADAKDPTVRPGEERLYFGELEEAVVAESTKRCLATFRAEPLFREEVDAVDRLQRWVHAYYRRRGMSEGQIRAREEELKTVNAPQDKVARVLAFSEDEEKREEYAAGMFSALLEKGEVHLVERYPLRKKMYALFDTIVERSEGAFSHRDEVFELFARANFTGNYLPLAREVERILGKGSFRKIAEDFSENSGKNTDTPDGSEKTLK